MFERIKEEKQRLNPIRRTVNYVIIPVYCATCFALLVPMICLMEIDDQKYLPVFLACVGFFVLLTAALLISIPFTRRKEVAIELENYDFDVKSAEPRDKYFFVQAVLAATFPLSSSPFAEFKNGNATFSGTDGLRQLLDYYGLNLESGKLNKSIPEYGAVSVADYSDNARYTDFYADAHDEGELKIYASHTVIVNDDGMSVNGVRLGLKNAHAEIITYNFLMHVQIYLNFLFEDEELTVSLRLSKDVLAIIDKFSITVENRELLDFILNDPQVAFEEILKRGRITEKRLKKISR